LARGAALTSAKAPRFDTSTIGLAYSQDPDGTTALLGYEGALFDADIGSHIDDAQERRKPFALGGALTAVFAVGMTALTIAMAVNIQPNLERAAGAIPMRPSAAAAPPAARSTQPAAPQPAPATVPDATPAAPATCRRDGTADDSARSAAAAGGRAQRCARPCSARPGSAAARRASAGADRPVAGTVAPTNFATVPSLPSAAARAGVVSGALGPVPAGTAARGW
jgi:hypothetical protein